MAALPYPGTTNALFDERVEIVSSTQQATGGTVTRPANHVAFNRTMSLGSTTQPVVSGGSQTHGQALANLQIVRLWPAAPSTGGGGWAVGGGRG